MYRRILFVMPNVRTLERAVARFVRRRRLWGADDRIAVAVSGGSDSVALAFIIRDLEHVGLGRPAGLIHVNHQLRGAEAEADEAFCAALAARLGWPIDVARVDVARIARERRQSVESAARDARYECFERAAERLGAAIVATGHTADDQAETVLLRLLRGAGTRGLSGIRARRGVYARPLLECRRAELRRDLAQRGETFRDDSSNLDLSIPRNRLRQSLMPVIEAMAPGGVRALARLAGLAEDDEDVLTKLAIETAGTLVLSRGGAPGRPEALEIDAAALRSIPPAIGRRVLRALAAEVAPRAAPGAVQLQSIWRLVQADKPRGHLDLAGLTVDRLGDVVRFSPGLKTRPPLRRAESLGPKRLDVPGSVYLPEAGVTISAERRERGVELSKDGARACVQADSVDMPLGVRTRRPGDRFRPLGSPGRRKLQDVLVDRKVPRDERDRVPVVVDARGRLVWVAGVALADECRVTAPEAGVVILKLRAKE
jgi:tRNA(Ile)-lysidine synthase